MFLNQFKKKLNTTHRRILLLSLVIIIGIPLWSFLYNLQETNALGIDRLGEERYAIRIRDSILLAVALFVICVLGVAPGVFLSGKAKSAYTAVVDSLSAKDVVQLQHQLVLFSGYNKIWPPYIVKDKDLLLFVFSSFKSAYTAIPVEDIIEINIKYSYLRIVQFGFSFRFGFSARLKTTYGTFKLELFNTDISKINHFIEQVKKENTKAVVNTDVRCLDSPVF